MCEFAKRRNFHGRRIYQTISGTLQKTDLDRLDASAALRLDRRLLYKMLEALERAKDCPDWKKEGGRYIPYPARWLKVCGWENDYAVPLQNCVPGQQPCLQKMNFTQRQYSPEYLNQFYVQDENPE